ncbi:MAG: hypothetical protein GXO75_08640 [Calditrichaeota bacterium]|nr:hypothetical protein [Calditrichota bacterium]
MGEINYYSSWSMPIAEKQAQPFAGIRRISGANFYQLDCLFGKALAKTFVSLGSADR